VESFAAEHGERLRGKLVIDATNRMGAASANSRAVLPPDIRYARAFNTTSGENMAEPEIDGVRCDMFFSAPEADRRTVEGVIEGVGLRPVYVGADAEELVDCLFRLWVALAVTQGRGRRMALAMLGGAP
jgi:8-hydroxy-5-deazaflavin:NADPH oxidoreductase